MSEQHAQIAQPLLKAVDNDRFLADYATDLTKVRCDPSEVRRMRGGR